MTCEEFTDRLPDYLDDTLDADVRGDARRHLVACHECQAALRRTQALGRALRCGLERETAHLALSPDTWKTLLHAERLARAEASAGRTAWQWLFGHPLRALSVAAALAAALLVAERWQRQHSDQRAEDRRARITWSIDVPFQSGSQVGVIHADYAEP